MNYLIEKSHSFPQLANAFHNDYLHPIKHFLLILFILFASTANAQTFYKTPSGKKYHLAECRMVKNVSEEITETEARKLGLEPCKICKPTDIYKSQSNSKKKAQGKATTTQCLGRTKAGSRCKHMTSIANGYCYQHQP